MVALKGTNGVIFVSLAAIAGLSASAVAQPRVEYGVIGSISDFPLGGAWPNLVTSDLPSGAALDPVDSDRVYVNDPHIGYLMSPSGVQRLLKWGDQIPGLPAGTTWPGASSFSGTTWMPLADGSVAVTNLAMNRNWTLRFNGSQFSIIGSTRSAVSADTAIGEIGTEYIGVGPVGGPFVPVMPNFNLNAGAHYAIEGMPGYEYRSIWGGLGALTSGLGAWVISATTNTQTHIEGPTILAPVDGVTGRIGPIVRTGDFVPAMGGIVNNSRYIGYLAIGATAEGDIAISVRVTRGAATSNEIWRLSRSGSWRNVLNFPCTVAGLPAGTVATGISPSGLLCVNSYGQVLAHVSISSPSLPADSTAFVLIDNAGARSVFRPGQNYPGILSGLPMTFLHAELGEDGCVAVFGQAAATGHALMLYRDGVGLVEVASTQRPVANGMLVSVAPERLWRSTGRSLRCATDGQGSLFDRDGRYRFIAYVNDGPRHSTVVYTAKLPPLCLADFDGDGFVDSFDYDKFVACFEGGACPPGKTADFDGDGFVDSFDYDGFVAAFEGGCEG